MADPNQEPTEESSEAVESPSELQESTLLEEDDDLLAIKASNDEAVELTDNYGIFQQEEGMIAWSLQNFYNEDGTPRTKRELRLDPAVLRIEDASGGYADFVLTREFTKSLNESLEQVYLATFGLHKTKKPMTSFKEALIASAVEKPLRAVLLAVIVILTPLFLFVF